MEYAESRMNAEAARPTPEVTTIFTPINCILLSLFLYIAYHQFKPKTLRSLPRAAAPIVFQTFTPLTLKPYNGLENPQVYLAVRGKVFDVSPGRNFYGPGGPYENFAGRDASRGLAHGSFDVAMLTKDLEGSLDDLKDLDAEQVDALNGWEERFNEKYLVVGRLVSVEEKKRLDAEAEAKA